MNPPLTPEKALAVGAIGVGIGGLALLGRDIRHAEGHAHLDFFPFADPATQSYGLMLRREF